METMPSWPLYTAVVIPALFIAAGLSVYLQKMDFAGAAAGVLIALGIFLGGGWPLLVLLLVFFVAGNLATSWRLDRKAALGLAEGGGQPRSVANALANGGLAAILGLWAWLDPAATLPLPAMMAAALASATSDTFSSELGNVYGRRYVNILTFAPDTRGADGVISLEGTLFGLAGSLLIAALFAIFYPAGVEMVAGVAIAGLAGNLADSLLGATLQRRGWLDNHQVNFCNTLVGAVVLAVYLW